MSEAQPGVLERILARFQAKKGSQPQDKETEWIDDPNDPSKKIKNPKFGEGLEPTPQGLTDLYAGLYEPKKVDPKNQAPRFNLSSDAISKAAGKMDFMQGLPPELAEKMQGNAFDAETLSALLNHVGRSAYSRAMEHSSSLTDNYVEARVSHESQGLPDSIRTHLAKSRTMSKLSSDNPVVREHMSMISERIANKFPDATEEEVAELTNEYFTTMAREINPQAFQQQEGSKDKQGRDFRPQAGEIQDFDAYLSGEKNLEQAKQPLPAQSSKKP